jgi:hypothetical protein
LDRRRESKVGQKVEQIRLVEGASWRRTGGQPENKTFDESRRLGLKAGLEGWQPAQAGGRPEGGAGERD